MPITTVESGSGTKPARVEVSSPLGRRDLRALPDGPCVVQCSAPLAMTEHESLGEWFADHPDADLRVYASLPPTLDFLGCYPRLSGFLLDCAYSDLTDASGLRFLPDSLRRLSIDVRLPGRDDLDTLHRLHELRSLRLGNIRKIPAAVKGLPITELYLGDVKSLGAITTLTSIQTLRLNHVTADLTPLLALDQLADLTLAIGGSNDLTPLAQLTSLRRFAAWLVRGLDNVAPLGHVSHLEELHLEKLRRVTALPPLLEARALATITLVGMRGLRDLRPLRDAPALRNLALIEMGHLQVSDVAVLAGHPTLLHVNVGLSGIRKNLAVREALRIPGNYGGYPWPLPAAV